VQQVRKVKLVLSVIPEQKDQQEQLAIQAQLVTLARKVKLV
jgi:hypothetical protein